MKAEDEVARLGGEMDGKNRGAFSEYADAKKFADWLAQNRHEHRGVTKLRGKWGVEFRAPFGGSD